MMDCATPRAICSTTAPAASAPCAPAAAPTLGTKMFAAADAAAIVAIAVAASPPHAPHPAAADCTPMPLLAAGAWARGCIWPSVCCICGVGAGA